jgi:hypothetical protein
MTDARPEPWPGYADESARTRKTKLQFKLEEASARGDALYAQAVAAAVANYEAHARDSDADEGEAEGEARQHFDDAGSWGHR